MDIKKEKRKWQIALRRYVIEGQPAAQYAIYFGLDAEHFRAWVELQFPKGISWEDFGTKWQFGHIVPVSYFNLQNEDELKLCWNFLNIQVETIGEEKGGIDAIAARPYFEAIYKETGNTTCLKFLEKLSSMEKIDSYRINAINSFLAQHKSHLENISKLDANEILRLNSGTSMENIIAEKDIAKKFG